MFFWIFDTKQVKIDQKTNKQPKHLRQLKKKKNATIQEVCALLKWDQIKIDM